MIVMLALLGWGIGDVTYRLSGGKAWGLILAIAGVFAAVGLGMKGW